MKNNVDEIVNDIINMSPYWWRWEFLKIKQDTPEIHDEVYKKFMEKKEEFLNK